MSRDFDFEPVPGLPSDLPKGEALLWQGRPEWRSLAIRAFHLRKIVVYFGLLAVWSVASAWVDGKPLGEALYAAAWVPVIAIGAIVPLTLLAWLSARTTVYTITSKRIVMRIGIALPITINVPFRAIESIGLRRVGAEAGDIPAALSKGYRLAVLVLWPHTRPWYVRNPQPMLRSVPNAERVARILVDAISADSAQVPRPVAAAVPEPERRPVRGAPVSVAAA